MDSNGQRAIALAVLAAALLAGCAGSPTDRPADRRGGGGDLLLDGAPAYLAVELVGSVWGLDSNGTVNGDSCGSYRPYAVDPANRSIAYDASHLHLPSSPTAVLVLDGSFWHPGSMPCDPFSGLGAFQGEALQVGLRVDPFEWSRGFALDGDTLAHADGRIPPGGSWRVKVDETHGDIRYEGFLEVRNLGRWPQDRLVAVAGPDGL